MRRTLTIILLFMVSIWSYVSIFDQEQDWNVFYSPWFGEVEEVSRYMSTGGSKIYQLTLKPNQLEEWKQMFEEAGIGTTLSKDKFETTSPFKIRSSSGNTYSVVFYTSGFNYDQGQNFWITRDITPNPEAALLPIQYPELEDKWSDIVRESMQIILVLTGTALLVCCFVSPQKNWAYIKGIGLIAMLVGTMSVCSCMGFNYRWSSNFGNYEIMISLIIAGGFCNSLLWTIIYLVRKHRQKKPLANEC